MKIKLFEERSVIEMLPIPAGAVGIFDQRDVPLGFSLGERTEGGVHVYFPKGNKWIRKELTGTMANMIIGLVELYREGSNESENWTRLGSL